MPTPFQEWDNLCTCASINILGPNMLLLLAKQPSPLMEDVMRKRILSATVGIDPRITVMIRSPCEKALTMLRSHVRPARRAEDRRDRIALQALRAFLAPLKGDTFPEAVMRKALRIEQALRCIGAPPLCKWLSKTVSWETTKQGNRFYIKHQDQNGKGRQFW